MTVTEHGEDRLLAEVRAAFAPIEMREPVAGLHVRVRRTRVRRTAIGAALAVALVLATTGIVFARGHGHQQVSPVPPAVADFDRHCHWSWEARHDASIYPGTELPPLDLVLDPGQPGGLIYADDHGEVLCARSDIGSIEFSGRNWDSDSNYIARPAEDVAGMGGSNFNNPTFNGYVFGGIPPGVTRVDLLLSSGATVHARLGSRVFGYADPGSTATVYQTAIFRAGGFSLMTWLVDQSGVNPPTRTCDKGVAWALAHGLDLSPAQRAQHPRLVHTLDMDGEPVDFYASDGAFLDCIGGFLLGAWFPDVPFSAQPDGLSTLLYDPHNPTYGWVAGRVPAGTVTVEARLSTYRIVPATVADGFYFAQFIPNPGAASVTAYTADKIFTTTVDGASTVTPR